MKKMIASCFLLLLLGLGELSALYYPGIVLRSRNCGMFSNFFEVLCLIRSYEQEKLPYIKVDFFNTGLYYDPNKGLNWWNYYFEPIEYGEKSSYDLVLTGGFKEVSAFGLERSISREDANRIIRNYIFIKEPILKEIDEFVAQNFDGHYVVGVHYRGTDKISEAPRTRYDIAAEKIADVVMSLGDTDYTIFLATDEQDFLDYLQILFPGKVCYVKEAQRSRNGKPLHQGSSNPYLSGKFALVDCILLSRCNLLIRTSSNLSLASTYFNADIPVIEISKRYAK